MRFYENTYTKFFYGTAWKEDRTPDLTVKALQAGFRAIDTANQRKHYFEEGVGQGMRKFLETNPLNREELFLQTKFTFARGQDHRKPYREEDSFSQQVADSFASSLAHLNTTYIDSYVLHGPYGYGIGQQDLETWAAMETLIDKKQVKCLGVSNVDAQQLKELCGAVHVKPAFVQNRCYANTGWDFEVREICSTEGITYQGFSLLTANRAELQAPEIAALARKYQKSVPQIIFRFCHQLGMICLTGTSDPIHMRQDLDINDFELRADEVSVIAGGEFSRVQ